jgi:hypothetical protein
VRGEHESGDEFCHAKPPRLVSSEAGGGGGTGRHLAVAKGGPVSE